MPEKEHDRARFDDGHVLVGRSDCLLGADEPKPEKKAATSGTILGLVRFTGKVPDATIIPTTDGGQTQHRDLVVDAKTNGLRHVMVFLEDAPVQPKLQKAQAAVVDQRDLLFAPRVLAVQQGQPVRFENNDLCNHSVQASSTIKANQLNVIAGPGQPVTHTFALQKAPVLIGCSLHGWMRGWIYVVPHPWFTIPNVPAGKYKLSFVHPDTNLRDSRMIEVKSGEKAELQIEWVKVPK
jgi:plastocyanin